MDATSYSDLKKVRNTILFTLLLFAGLNHTVKIVSPRLGGGGDLLSFGIAAGVQSYDRFRIELGNALMRVDRVCGDTERPYCDSVLKGTAQILGLK